MDRREELKQYGLYDPRFEHDACGVGFVCNVSGEKSNKIIRQGLDVLKRLSHRGATGADPETGDGAGILMQLPHDFFLKAARRDAKIDLPRQGEYATGLVFFPTEKKEFVLCQETFLKFIEENGQYLLGWRDVPVDVSVIGKGARESKPVIMQVFIGRNKRIKEELDFERRLYIIRKQIENSIRISSLKQKSFFYITNISCRTFSYKGLLMPHQVEKFFIDLKDEDIKSALSLVHSRYSTNTFPTWDLSQPFRFLAHNGEINTLRGNINWMLARESLLKSEVFGRDIKKTFPVIVPGGSDSAAIDNVFELLSLSGRSMPQAMMMLIPAAWEHNDLLDEKTRDFYKYHSCLMEPWDGPAAIAFTDGIRIGAVLDRNGLRPARYIITKENFVVMASEAGVLDVNPEDIAVSGRLEPGKIFFIDTQSRRIIDDRELKEMISGDQPYGKWLRENMVQLEDLAPVQTTSGEREEDINKLMKAFGYTREDLKTIIKPMAEKAQEPIGSMGSDTPHAVLSIRPQLLYNYFKQLFAQVTNPAIDPIREELVMSLETYLGPEKNVLEETPGHCHKLRVGQPILTNEELERIRNIKQENFKTKTISILFDSRKRKPEYFISALKKICKEAESAIKDGYTFIILSDRGLNRQYAAIPALLAGAAVHHYLVKRALRTQIGIIVESAEPREVHHFALLFGYGVDCVNPYFAYQVIDYLLEEKILLLHSREKALANYIKALNKGILKILSKMGISTLQSYRGAQIFEALGLGRQVIEICFSGTVSRIGGIGFAEILTEILERYDRAYPEREYDSPLSSGGVYQWKKDGEFHLWNPETISALQDSVWKEDYKRYKEFADLINHQVSQPVTLRSLLKFKAAKSVPIEEVEPVEEIVKRFATGAMSFGSISKETHETIAIAMNRLKGKSNTGEGGEDSARFVPLPNGDSRRSAIKQIASGRFGVTTNYLVNADEIQIKIAQGAKPGEGGQLPGDKVSVTIAKTRYTTPGVTLISPPPHHDIYSIEDLAQLIFDLKNTNPGARISVKLVSEIGVGTVAAGVAKGHAGMILISGFDGGTGASPLSSIKHAGLPWELGLSETHQSLVLNDLRGRVRLQTDGQMRTGRDVAVACLLGAEEFGFCSSVLVTLGCVMLRHCNLNNCSVGVATQDEVLRKRFRGRPEYIINYFRFVAEELREIMSCLGVKTIEEMVGRTDLLEINKDVLPPKAREIDLSKLLYRPVVDNSVNTHYVSSGKTEDFLSGLLDNKLITLAKDALENSKQVNIELPINNTDRTCGAMLSGRVCLSRGEEAFPEDTIKCKFKGIAGQSFAAWLVKGITFELEGIANDYVGKGIFGGKVIIYPDRKSGYKPQENIIIGNTAFYGAINGEAYICGVAGERFCIRNSGLFAVVEGVGDHGCEYMTGGSVVILGRTGRNFAAGMSGGIAYVYNPYGDFKEKCNMGMVELGELDREDLKVVQRLISNHYKYTRSELAGKVMDNFKEETAKFIKVIPVEYQRIIHSRKSRENLGLTEDTEG